MANDYTTRYRNPNRANRWQDWANLILAIWLFISPWVLQFGSGVVTANPATPGAPLAVVGAAAWNAWVLGVITFLVALSAIGRMEFWQEWINLLLGIWIFVAPWALGFASGLFAAAAWDHWIVGALMFLFSILNLAAARPDTAGAGGVRSDRAVPPERVVPSERPVEPPVPPETTSADRPPRRPR